MTGAELQAVVSITDRLFAAADVSFVRGRQAVNPAADVNSEWLAEMPPTRTRLAMRYERRLTRGAAFVEIEGIYSAEQSHVDTDLRESETPEYTLLHARVGGSFGRLRFSVGLSNCSTAPAWSTCRTSAIPSDRVRRSASRAATSTRTWRWCASVSPPFRGATRARGPQRRSGPP